MNTHDRRLELIGRCVDCTSETLTHSPDKLQCSNCGREYPIDKDGVIHAMPLAASSQLPSFYRSAFFKHWTEIWEQHIAEWTIYKNAFYRWFSMSGHKRVLQLVSKLPPSEIIVDFGCGHGQLFELIDPRRAIGVDSNLNFLRLLKRRFPDAVAIHGDISNTIFKSGSLACPVSLHTLEHLYFIAEALEEIKRLLKPSGEFIFSIPTEGGFGWELGRSLVTGRWLKAKHGLDVHQVMAIEHVNDAKRTLKFLKLYFELSDLYYSPFPYLPILSVNSAITGSARLSQ